MPGVAGAHDVGGGDYFRVGLLAPRRADVVRPDRGRVSRPRAPPRGPVSVSFPSSACLWFLPRLVERMVF